MATPSRNLSALSRQRRRPTPTIPDPYANEPSADDLLAGARGALADAERWTAPTLADQRAARTTRAGDILTRTLEDIDRPAGQRNLSDVIAGRPSAAEPEDDRAWYTKAYDWFASPFKPVQRQIERNRAHSEFRRVMAEEGDPNWSYNPAGDLLEEMLLGQLSPANVAGAVAPLAGASRAASAFRGGLGAADIGGAGIETARAVTAEDPAEARQHGLAAVLMGISGLGTAADLRGAGRRPLAGELVDDDIPFHLGILEDETRALPPGPDNLPPRRPRALPPAGGAPIDDVLEAELAGATATRPPSAEAQAAARDRRFWTPPPDAPPAGVIDAEFTAPEPARPVPPTSSDRRFWQPGAEDLAPAPPIDAPPPFYQPQKPIEFLGRKIVRVDVAGQEPTITFSNGDTLPVSPELLDGLREFDPAVPRFETPIGEPDLAGLGRVADEDPLAAMFQEPAAPAGPSARELRENRNAAALARYRGQFDPLTMEAIEAFAERNPRVFSTFTMEPGAPQAGRRAEFTPFAEPQGARVGATRLRAPQPGETMEDILQAIEHEAVHGTQARRLGAEEFTRQSNAEAALPYREQPMESAAFGVQNRRAAKRAGRQADDELSGLIRGLEAELVQPPRVDAEVDTPRVNGAVDQDPLEAWLEELQNVGREMAPDDLVRAAFTDELTGLPNRRGLSALEQRRGPGERMSAAVDIKNLKAANDILGYDQGDALVRAVADELRGTLRAGEVPARFGGDEFMLDLEGVDDAGRPVVEAKIQQAIDRALERFGTRQAGEFPLGGRVGLGRTRDEAMAAVNALKAAEKGPRYRDLKGEAGASTPGGKPAAVLDEPDLEEFLFGGVTPKTDAPGGIRTSPEESLPAAQKNLSSGKSETPANVRSFLEQRLGFSPEEVDAMAPDQAIATGQARAASPAAERYETAIDELSELFEQEQPRRIQRAAERRRQARSVPALPPGPGTGPAPTASPRALARSRQMAEEIAGEQPPKSGSRTPQELRAIQSEQVQRTREIGRAMQAKDYDRAAALIGEQAEKWNQARLREGTGGENKVPPKYRNGEYLASDFAAIHRFLFTPEGRAALKEGAQDLAKLSVTLAKNPAVRGVIGGIVGASTGDTTDEQFSRFIAGAIMAAGGPRGVKVLGQALDHYRRTGKVMRKAPDVPNADIGFWRTFIAPSTVERSVPELFATVRDTLKDLQDFRASGTGDAAANAAFERLTRRDLISYVREAAEEASGKGQANLSRRLKATADHMEGRPTRGQEIVKDVLRFAGKKNATGRELEHAVQRNTYRILLGYALDSAAKNLFQPTLALLHVSPRNMAAGLRAARSQAGRELFDSLELNLSRPADTGDEITDILGVEKPPSRLDPGAAMRATDNWNRRWVFLSHLAEQGELEAALGGRASKKAMDDAQRVMRLTQGDAGPMSSSPYFRGPIGGSLKPFTKFPNLFIENALDALNGDAKYPKQAVLTILALGLSGAAYGLDTMDLLIGGGRPLGLDPMHPRRTQAPPAVKAGGIAGQYISGERRVFGDFVPTSANPRDILETDLAYLLLGRYPTKVAKTGMDLVSGASEDPVSDVASLGGLTTQRRADERSTRQDAYEMVQESRQRRASEAARRNAAYDRAIRSGDDAGRRRLEEGLSSPQVRALRRRMTQGRLERLRSQLPISEREQFDREFGEALAKERAQPR